MSKHTPGPWTQDDTHGRRFIERVGTEETVAIACKVDGKDGWKIMNANASLIAAAPDLIEALEALKREVILSDVDMDYIKHHFQPWLDKAAAAIAKARGES